jgi:hypothetical protein
MNLFHKTKKEKPILALEYQKSLYLTTSSLNLELPSKNLCKNMETNGDTKSVL